jgi:hypothetical protein
MWTLNQILITIMLTPKECSGKPRRLYPFGGSRTWSKSINVDNSGWALPSEQREKRDKEDAS